MMRKVNGHITPPNYATGAGVRFGTAEYRSDSGQKLIRGERLRQVIIGTHVQRANLVALVAASTDDDDGGNPLGIELTEYLPAVDEREPDVEEDDVDA
jgi:hypothetical protein